VQKKERDYMVNAEYPDFITTTGYGKPDGLCGVNCRHSFFFVSESQPRAYSDEQLGEMAKAEAVKKSYTCTNKRGEDVTKEYTQYEASQRMRQLENDMRKRRTKIAACKAAGNDESARAERVKYRAEIAEYKRFAETMELREQRERIYNDSLGRV
jgi:hypothetical protein